MGRAHRRAAREPDHPAGSAPQGAPPRFRKALRNVYFAMMAVAFLCIVVTGGDTCLAILLAGTVFGLVSASITGKGFWD